MKELIYITYKYIYTNIYKTGYIFDLNIYAGKTENDEFSEGALGERVVTKLCATIKIFHVVMYFDRYFTCVNLVHTLPFSAVGTVIKSRKNFPKFAKCLEKGESKFLATSLGVVASRWIDSKEVIVISNCLLPETTSINRKQKDGTKKQFQCPNSIALYNQSMGGVDLSDQKANVYDFNKKSTKWWKKDFYKIQMSAAINAHIFHQATTKTKTPLLKYLVNLAEQLFLTGCKSARVKRKTNSNGGPRSNEQRNSSVSETTCQLKTKEDDDTLDVYKRRLKSVQDIYFILIYSSPSVVAHG